MLKDPKLLRVDPPYSLYGPIGFCEIFQEEYRKLFSEREWPVLQETIPQGNLANVKETVVKKFFEYNSLHHLRSRCPKLGRDKLGGNNDNNNNDNNINNNNNVNPRGQNNNNVNRFGDTFAWKYVVSSDLDTTKEHQGQTWKFYNVCVCKFTNKKGFYNLSHSTSQHRTGAGNTDVAGVAEEGNLASTTTSSSSLTSESKVFLLLVVKNNPILHLIMMIRMGMMHWNSKAYRWLRLMILPPTRRKTIPLFLLFLFVRFFLLPLYFTLFHTLLHLAQCCKQGSMHYPILNMVGPPLLFVENPTGESFQNDFSCSDFVVLSS